MEVHELKEWMNERFESLDKNIDKRLTSVDSCIEKLDKKVTSHDRWLWFLRGAVAVFLVVISWIGIKIRL
jgi:hypothetical protein